MSFGVNTSYGFGSSGSGGGGGVGTLQQVTDLGNSTTNNIEFVDPAGSLVLGMRFLVGADEKWQIVQEGNAPGDSFLRITDTVKGINSMSFFTTNQIGVFNNAPTYSFDITGSLRATEEVYLGTNGKVVGVNTTSVHVSALFQIDSTTKGVLKPRLTTAQRNAIVAPATGLEVYNSTLNTSDYYNGTSWLSKVTGSGTASYVSVFDAANNIKGYSYFTVIDGLYPTIAIGANGVTPVGFRFKTNAASDYSYISPGTGLTFYGSNTYPFIDFYDRAGGTQVLRLWNSGGYVAQFAGRIGTTTTSTAGTNLGAFNIDRTFAELSSGPNQHGYVDKSVFRYGASALNSFYSEITAGTTNAAYTQNHIAHFQSLLTKDGANTLAIQYDYVALATLLNGGTLTNRYGFYMFDANPAGGGTLTNQYGIYIPALVGAATKNIGIFSANVVTIGTDAPSASALLQVDSTTKGFLLPRMTGAQAEAIAAPAEGLAIYSTDGSGATITSKGWWGYDGATWVKWN